MPADTLGEFFLSSMSDGCTIGRWQGILSMQFDYYAIGRFIARQFVRFGWTTTQQKCTTTGALGGFVFSLLLPGFGLASGRGGIAGWMVAIPLLTALFGLAGNRVGVGREKAALLRQAQTSWARSKDA